MSLDKLNKIYQEADLLGYIKVGAGDNIYDPCAFYANYFLSKDSSLYQTQVVVWSSLYEEFCKGNILHESKQFVLDRRHAAAIMGGLELVKEISLTIRGELFNYKR